MQNKLADVLCKMYGIPYLN